MRAFLLTMSLLSMSGVAIAQPEPQAAPRTPRPAPQPEAATPAPPRIAPPTLGQPINIRVEVTINDQRGAGAPGLKKTVTVVTADGMSGFIRSSANYTGLGPVPLNVDTSPQILPDGKIRLRVNLEYDLPAPSIAGQPEPANTADRNLRVTQIRENLSLIVDSGRPIIAAQSADPVGDRQVTIEVKATVLR